MLTRNRRRVEIAYEEGIPPPLASVSINAESVVSVKLEAATSPAKTDPFSTEKPESKKPSTALASPPSDVVRETDGIGSGTDSVKFEEIVDFEDIKIPSDSTMIARKYWKATFDTIHKFRRTNRAPVDEMGCINLKNPLSTPNVQRFQILASLLLSSQTKDPVTARGIQNLHQLQHRQDPASTCGLNIDTILNATDAEVNACICKVGFHNRKTIYLRQVATICKNDYNNDIPLTVKELIQLPGIGPKMAYLAVQCAWNRNEGIGVDVHVHRISNRLGWTDAACLKKGPESTRMALESFVPRDMWAVLNPTLVGWGQTVCLPVRPLCSSCVLQKSCPSAGKCLPKKNKRLVG